jgi:two-component system, chemotaxis family, protein-glutamate methylesterase/glutaminase
MSLAGYCPREECSITHCEDFMGSSGPGRRYAHLLKPRSRQPMITPGTEQEPNDPVVLAVGGSAGSVQPLIEVVRDLSEDLPVSVLVTIHVGQQTRLPQILSRSGPLQATFARDREALEPGRIYIAPRGRHLIARDGLALLSPGPRVNRHRPAVDVMFASAAEWVAARAVGVVLSGALDDGAVGAALIDRAGGQVLVQDPAEAEFTGMPTAALLAASRARAVSVRGLAHEIRKAIDVARSPHSNLNAQGVTMRADMDMIDSDDPAFLREDETRLTRLTCPECGGGMAEVDLPQISYFRCHIGHQFSPQTLAAAQAEACEKKLWSAVAALEEQASVLRYLHQRLPSETEPALAKDDQRSASQDRYIDEVADRAAALRSQLRAWSINPPQLDVPPE